MGSGNFLYEGNCLFNDILEDFHKYTLFTVIKIHAVNDIAVDTGGSGKGFLDDFHKFAVLLHCALD